MNPSRQTSPIKVLIVDDHPVLRESLAAMITNEPGMALVAEAGTGAEGIQLFTANRPDVTIMDLRLPDMNGIDAIGKIRASYPDARIIVLTTYLGDVHASKALRDSADAFLLKAGFRAGVLNTIRAVYKSRKRVLAQVESEMAEYGADGSLTAREIEVLEQVASGNSNKLLAEHLDISEDTVKSHMRSIMSKLGANDRTHAVTIALRRGFLEM